MKAIRIHAFGGPETVQLEEIDKPVPGPGELLVRAEAASINPVDWEIRAGMLQDFLQHSFPLTLGCDIAGTVEAAGTGVEGFSTGDAVYAYLDLKRLGAFAEFVIVKADEAAPKPATLDFVHAASVPVASLTAWQALFDTAGLEAGQTVLVHGASGGVGSMAVQLAKWKGARAIGTASETNREYLQALGMDEFIDYKTTRFETVVHDADVVLDTQGGDTQERSFGVLKTGGFLVSLVQPPPPEKLNEHGLRGTMMGVVPNGKRLREVASLVDEGVLKTLVETVLPLEKASEALSLNQAGRSRGKIVLRIS